MTPYHLMVFTAFAVLLVADGSEIPSPDKQKTDMALRGMEDSINRIVSGIFRINGQTVKPGGNIVADDIFIVFDYSKHFYRLDNGNIGRSLLPPNYYYYYYEV